MKRLITTLFAIGCSVCGFAQQKAGGLTTSAEDSTIVWAPEAKKEMSAAMYAHFKTKLSAAQQARVGERRMHVLADCIVDKVFAAYTPTQIDAMPEDAVETFINRSAWRCNDELKLGMENMR